MTDMSLTRCMECGSDITTTGGILHFPGCGKRYLSVSSTFAPAASSPSPAEPPSGTHEMMTRGLNAVCATCGESWPCSASRESVIADMVATVRRVEALGELVRFETSANERRERFAEWEREVSGRAFLNRLAADFRNLLAFASDRLASPALPEGGTTAGQAIYAIRGDGVSEIVGVKLTEAESQSAASIYRDLQKREDPYALDRTIEAVIASRGAPVRATGEGIDVAHLQRQREWSERTFGPGTRVKGVVDHIRKELAEIEAEPESCEWVDVIILALDGFWRAGYTPEQIIAAIKAKQTRNEEREWPDWQTMSADAAIEHVRSTPPSPPVTE